MGEGADGAGDLADRHVRKGPVEAEGVAAHFLVADEELEAEGRGLGVYAVGASHARCVPKLEGAPPQYAAHPSDALAQEHARVADLQRERRVDHVARRHPEVHPT